MGKIQTAERVSQIDPSDNFVFQRSLLAYTKAASIISGNVLEIGTGSGYGVSVIAPQTDHLTTIDKHNVKKTSTESIPNVTFKKMDVPPLKNISSESFDYVICFQVIEHIKNDRLMIQEIKRVLKSEGKLIISTPNRHMSLTRNPWHVREYSIQEFKELLSGSFNHIEALGVFGNEKIIDYYNKNRESVKKITRYDIFDLQHKLPRCLLQIPYDIANRINRKKLLRKNDVLTRSISMDDYFFSDAKENCFDLFFIAHKNQKL